MLFNSGKKQFLAKWRGVNLFYAHLQKGTRLVLITAVLVAILAIVYLLQGLFHKQKASADLAKFYPAKCLGGWQYTAHAENMPDLDMVASVDDFTDVNSAVLDNAMAQLYCSNFNGENPIGTVPKKLTLRLSLAVKPKVLVPPVDTTNTEPVNNEEQVNPEAKPSEATENPGSEGAPAEAGSENKDEPKNDAGSEAAPVESVPVENPAPAEIPAPAATPEPTSLLPKSLLDRLVAWLMVGQAQAQEEVVATTSEDQVSSSPELIINNDNSEEASSSEDGIAKTEETVMPADALLEVSYTLDGQAWQSLGWVAESSWRDASFDLPLDGISDWSKLDMLQVRFDRVATLNDNQPIFYLDGMWLEAEYDAAIKEMVDSGVDQPDLLKDEILKKSQGKGFVAVNVIREKSGEQELWYGSTVGVDAKLDPFAAVGLWKKIELNEKETKPTLLDARAAMMFWVVNVDRSKRLYNRDFKTGNVSSVDANDDGSVEMNFDEDAYDGSGLRLVRLHCNNNGDYSFNQ